MAVSTSRTRAPRRLTRPARGFTLLELVVVGVISSVLFLLLVRWVSTMSASASVTLENAAVQRSLDVSAAAVAADADRAKPCAPGVASPVRSVSPDSLTFTVSDDTGTISHVTWAVRRAGSGPFELTRTVLPASPGDACLPDAGAASVLTYHRPLAAVETERILGGDRSRTPAFYTVTGGVATSSGAQAWGGCGSNEDAARCYADGFGVTWNLLSSERTNPITLSRAYTFATTTKDL